MKSSRPNSTQGQTQNFMLTGQSIKEKKKKKNQTSIHKVLKNYKYSKSFLKTLRYNHLPIKTKIKTK